MGTKHPLRANRCVAQAKQSGEQCKQYAIPGGQVCRYHGGDTPAVRAAANRLLADYAVLKEMRTLGVPVKVEPDEALLQMVNESAGNLVYLRKRVRELEEGITEDPKAESVVRLYNEERDRLARLAKMAVDAGISERRVRIEEEQGALLSTLIISVMEDARLGLSRPQMNLARYLMAEKLKLVQRLQDQQEAEILQLPSPPDEAS